jgi:hypothetical protein
MKWIKQIQQIIEYARSDAEDRAWFETYGAHIADLERTLAFECTRCVDCDPGPRLPLRYRLSDAIRYALRCYSCRRLLRLVTIK